MSALTDLRAIGPKIAKRNLIPPTTECKKTKTKQNKKGKRATVMRKFEIEMEVTHRGQP